MISVRFLFVVALLSQSVTSAPILCNRAPDDDDDGLKFCSGKDDGLYPYPHDCRCYIRCSENGTDLDIKPCAFDVDVYFDPDHQPLKCRRMIELTCERQERCNLTTAENCTLPTVTEAAAETTVPNETGRPPLGQWPPVETTVRPEETSLAGETGTGEPVAETSTAGQFGEGIPPEATSLAVETTQQTGTGELVAETSTAGQFGEGIPPEATSLAVETTQQTGTGELVAETSTAGQFGEGIPPEATSLAVETTQQTGTEATVAETSLPAQTIILGATGPADQSTEATSASTPLAVCHAELRSWCTWIDWWVADNNASICLNGQLYPRTTGEPECGLLLAEIDPEACSASNVTFLPETSCDDEQLATDLRRYRDARLPYTPLLAIVSTCRLCLTQNLTFTLSEIGIEIESANYARLAAVVQLGGVSAYNLQSHIWDGCSLDGNQLELCVDITGSTFDSSSVNITRTDCTNQCEI